MSGFQLPFCKLAVMHPHPRLLGTAVTDARISVFGERREAAQSAVDGTASFRHSVLWRLATRAPARGGSAIEPAITGDNGCILMVGVLAVQISGTRRELAGQIRYLRKARAQVTRRMEQQRRVFEKSAGQIPAERHERTMRALHSVRDRLDEEIVRLEGVLATMPKPEYRWRFWER